MIYFDNAATSFPKPDSVPERISFALRELGGNPGRSSHRLSMLADREVFACRVTAAEMFGTQPENVIFTYNATYALNMAIKASYRGGTILISDLEHNSVRRPVLSVCRDVRIFDSHPELSGEERTEAILASIRSKLHGVTLLCCLAASNICRAVLPFREIGKLCREHGIRFILDGSQAAGSMKLNLADDFIDILCLPGHKGLLGPQGTGLMLLGENVKLSSFIEGGSGSGSLEPVMPELPPERYEGGTLAVPSIAGLRAGMEFVNRRGIDNISAHETKLSRRFADGLRSLGRIRVYEPSCSVDSPGSIVLFRLPGYEPEESAAKLDSLGICVRAGFHCAPLAHNRIGTGSSGAIRASFGIFNTEGEIDSAIRTIGGLLTCKRR